MVNSSKWVTGLDQVRSLALAIDRSHWESALFKSSRSVIEINSGIYPALAHRGKRVRVPEPEF